MYTHKPYHQTLRALLTELVRTQKKTASAARNAATRLALLSLFPLASAAGSLSLHQAVEQALAANHELRALQYKAEQADIRLIAAGTLPDPKAQFTYFGQSVETRTGPQEAIYSLSQTIPWFEKLRVQKVQATLDAEARALLYEEGRLRLKEAVTRSFSEVAYLTQTVHSTEQNLQWIERAQQIVDQQVRAGLPLNALLRLEVELERTRDSLDSHAQALYSERTGLAVLMAIDESELPVVDTLETPGKELANADRLQTDLLTKNPELKALRRQLEGAEAETRRNKLQRFPDVILGINYIQIGDNGTPTLDAGRDSWNISIAVNLPIWEGKNRAMISAAHSAVHSIEQMYCQRLRSLQSELSATLNRHADNARRMERYRETLIPLAEQALENSQVAYESGQISVLEIIDSERALLDLQLKYWRTVAFLRQDQAKIEALTGQL